MITKSAYPILLLLKRQKANKTVDKQQIKADNNKDGAAAECIGRFAAAL